jgi:cell division protease FtsH
VLLTGRAAERLVFGKASTGAADDLAKAADIARSAAAQYGMVPALGDVAYDRPQGQFLSPREAPGWFERSYSEETAREIDCAVRDIVARAGQRAAKIIETRRELLERGARTLLDKETLTVPDLQALLGDCPPRLDLVAAVVPRRA